MPAGVKKLGRCEYGCLHGSILTVPLGGSAEGIEAPLRPLSFLSAVSLFALYSILFCSKLGSFRYSSRELASDTGACQATIRL